MIDVSGFIRFAAKVVAGAEIAPGVYRRHSGGDGEADPYGCADAANILYTIGALPGDARRRQAFVDGLNGLQNDDGLWREETHHEIHTTAHCVAAMELFDVRPARPLSGLASLTDPSAMEAFLDGLAWRDAPWTASHQGAGLHAALTLAGDATPDWRTRYVAWLWQEADAETGLWRRGALHPVHHSGVSSMFPHLAGSFHYLFALEYERAPLRYPDALIDTCLAIRADDVFPLGRTVGFAEIDWVYCLNRAMRQTAHRRDDALDALNAFADAYCSFLEDLEGEHLDRAHDLHNLFGALCALAELQSALPGRLSTEQPLRLVLDRRPFI